MSERTIRRLLRIPRLRLAQRIRQAGDDPRVRNGLVIGLFGFTALIFVQFAPFTGAMVGAVDITTRHTSPYMEDKARFQRSQNPLHVDQVDGIALAATFWRSVQDGDLRMWEPNLGTGAPLGGVIYTRVWSPFYWVGVAVPPPSLSAYAAWFALWSAQVGAWLLARRLHIGQPGAVLAGVAYGFAGTTLALLFRINEVSLAPWVLLGVHSVVSSDSPHRLKPVVGLAVAVTLTWLGGFPAASLFILYAAVGVALFSALLREGPHVIPVLRRAAPAGIGVISGTLLASPLILPSLEFLKASESLKRSYSSSHAAGFDLFGTSVSGRILGTYQYGDWWWPDPGYSNPVAASATIGMVVVLLLGVGSWAAHRCRPHSSAVRTVGRLYLPLGAVVFMGTFVGGPVLAALQLLPYMDSNEFGRSRFLLSLAAALAAGLILDGLVRPVRNNRTLDPPFRILAGLTAGAAVASAVMVLARSVELGFAERAFRGIAIPLVCAVVAALGLLALRWSHRIRLLSVVLVIAALTVELQWGAWGFTPIVGRDEGFFPEHEAFEVIRPEVSEGFYRFAGTALNVIRPNSAAYLDIADLRISNPSYERYRELMRAIDPDVFDRARLRTWFTDDFDPSSPALTRSAVRFLVAPASDGVLEAEDGENLPIRPGNAIDLPSADSSARGLSFLIDDKCSQGFLTVLMGEETVGRRPLWQLKPGEFQVAIEDVVGPAQLVIESEGCDVELPSIVTVLRATDDTSLRSLWADDAVIYERDEALPRFELATAVRGIVEPKRRLAFLASSRDIKTTILDGQMPVTELDGGSVKLLQDEGDRLSIRVDADGPGFLVVRDANAPGWLATVNGQPTKVLHADHSYRAVSVPSGASTVEMVYRPKTRVIGFALAAIPISGWAIAAVVWRRRKS